MRRTHGHVGKHVRGWRAQQYMCTYNCNSGLGVRGASGDQTARAACRDINVHAVHCCMRTCLGLSSAMLLNETLTLSVNSRTYTGTHTHIYLLRVKFAVLPVGELALVHLHLGVGDQLSVFRERDAELVAAECRHAGRERVECHAAGLGLCAGSGLHGLEPLGVISRCRQQGRDAIEPRVEIRSDHVERFHLALEPRVERFYLGLEIVLKLLVVLVEFGQQVDHILFRSALHLAYKTGASKQVDQRSGCTMAAALPHLQTHLAVDAVSVNVINGGVDRCW